MADRDPRTVAYQQQLMAAVDEAAHHKVGRAMAEGIGRFACEQLPDVPPIAVGRALVLLGTYMAGFNHQPPHPTYEPVAMILGGLLLAPSSARPPTADGKDS